MKTKRVSYQRQWRSVAVGLSVSGAILMMAGCGGGSSTSSNNSLPKSYSIVDLGTLPGGTSSVAAALNNKGEVVGTSTETSANGVANAQAFVWKSGQMTALGMLPGGRTSHATGINDNGQVCGTSDTGSGVQAFLYTNGALTSIGNLPGDIGSAALGLNASGLVAVSSFPSVPTPSPNSYQVQPAHAAVYSQGSLTEISVPVGDIAITPDAINALGQVAGTSVNQNKVSRAFLYQNGSLLFPGTLPGDDSSQADAINASSQAVGASNRKIGTDNSGQNPVFVSQAVLFTAGKVTGLGMLPGDTNSVATGINDSGQIIGTSTSGATDPTLASHPFIWQQGQLVSLNSLLPIGSGWILTGATGINNTGQICGYGQHNGQTRAFLLTPQQ